MRVLGTSFARKRLIAYVNVRLLRVERLLPPFPAVSFDDVSYSGGLSERVTLAVRDHSCAGPILGFLTKRKLVRRNTLLKGSDWTLRGSQLFKNPEKRN